jgi:hypothetical protein
MGQRPGHGERRIGCHSGNDHRVLGQIYEHPLVSVTDVRALLGITFAGANQIAQRLVNLKILIEVTAQARHRRVPYDSYVWLFDDETRA